MLRQPIRWNLPLICHLFDQDTILNILSVHLVDADMPDEIIWAPNRNEKRSIRAFYLLDYGIDFQAQMRGYGRLDGVQRCMKGSRSTFGASQVDVSPGLTMRRLTDLSVKLEAME